MNYLQHYSRYDILVVNDDIKAINEIEYIYADFTLLAILIPPLNINSERRGAV